MVFFTKKQTFNFHTCIYPNQLFFKKTVAQIIYNEKLNTEYIIIEGPAASLYEFANVFPERVAIKLFYFLSVIF